MRINLPLRVAGMAAPVHARDHDMSREHAAMVPAYVATMNGVEGWDMRAEEIPGGAALSVTSAELEPIRALGLFGIMTVDAYHQAHDLARASGPSPFGR